MANDSSGISSEDDYHGGFSGDDPGPPPDGLVSEGKSPTNWANDQLRRFLDKGAEIPPDMLDEQRAVLLKPGDAVNDRFDVVRQLGFGGMGAVYQVKDRITGQDRALKVMLPSLLKNEAAQQRFVDEVAISQELVHEGVVRVYDLGEDRQRGIRFFTMEYIEGRTLHRLLNERGGKLPLDEALHVARQLCLVLDYAHRFTVHRDLKPQNIMVKNDWSIKVLDFGLAKLMSPGRLTKSSMALGTAYYQAPEQSVKLAKLDQRADLYSAGIILYQLLTGRIAIGRVKAPSQLDPAIPKALDDVVLTCIEPEPEDRYTNAAGLLAELDRVASASGRQSPALGASEEDGRAEARSSPDAVGVVRASAARARQDGLVGGTLGDYEILGELGRGGMGVVYKAHEKTLRRVVALKVLPDDLSRKGEFVQRFMREARAAAQLVHPNIAVVYTAGEIDGLHYIAMQYVQGRTLSEEIAERGPFEAEEALAITRDAAKALGDAHAHGIVHRDVKPQNIMIDTSGHVRVMDFGLAGLLAERSGVSRPGMPLGTPHYMSPEQMRGETTDARTDMYSLGITLYEMLAGRPPFDADSDMALMYKLLNEPLPNLRERNPGIPFEIVRVVERMTAKEAEERYASMVELCADLDGLDGTGLSVPATPIDVDIHLASDPPVQQGTAASPTPRPLPPVPPPGLTGTKAIPPEPRRARKLLQPFIVVGATVLAGFVLAAIVVLLPRYRAEKPLALENEAGGEPTISVEVAADTDDREVSPQDSPQDQDEASGAPENDGTEEHATPDYAYVLACTQMEDATEDEDEYEPKLVEGDPLLAEFREGWQLLEEMYPRSTPAHIYWAVRTVYDAREFFPDLTPIECMNLITGEMADATPQTSRLVGSVADEIYARLEDEYWRLCDQAAAEENALRAAQARSQGGTSAFDRALSNSARGRKAGLSSIQSATEERVRREQIENARRASERATSTRRTWTVGR